MINCKKGLHPYSWLINQICNHSYDYSLNQTPLRPLPLLTAADCLAAQQTYSPEIHLVHHLRPLPELPDLPVCVWKELANKLMEPEKDDEISYRIMII